MCDNELKMHGAVDLDPMIKWNSAYIKFSRTRMSIEKRRLAEMSITMEDELRLHKQYKELLCRERELAKETSELQLHWKELIFREWTLINKHENENPDWSNHTRHEPCPYCGNGVFRVQPGEIIIPNPHLTSVIPTKPEYPKRKRKNKTSPSVGITGRGGDNGKPGADGKYHQENWWDTWDKQKVKRGVIDTLLMSIVMVALLLVLMELLGLALTI